MRHEELDETATTVYKGSSRRQRWSSTTLSECREQAIDALLTLKFSCYFTGPNEGLYKLRQVSRFTQI
jgi:hypothetical protein